jgi:hypothetical protein
VNFDKTFDSIWKSFQLFLIAKFFNFGPEKSSLEDDFSEVRQLNLLQDGVQNFHKCFPKAIKSFQEYRSVNSEKKIQVHRYFHFHVINSVSFFENKKLLFQSCSYRESFI